MTKDLPANLTSYDLLKSLALILMVLDHVGHFFYPDEMWFRIVGRMCVPIWLFLIGYARSQDLSKGLWVGCALVALSAYVAGQFVLPLNILCTIILIRWLRGYFVIAAFRSAETLRGLFFILFFLTFPTALLFEYGAMGMMFALFGYAVRNKEIIGAQMEVRYLKYFAAASLFSFYIWQGVMMPHVSDAQALVLLFGLGGVGLLLWRFRGVEYQDSTRIMAGSFVKIFQMMGRRTLEIYVAHIIIFRGVCMYLYPQDYPLLELKILPEGALGLFM